MKESAALRSWTALNNVVRTADEKTCNQLMEEELKGQKRRMFVMRIHSRMNKIRADRERSELRERLK